MTIYDRDMTQGQGQKCLIFTVQALIIAYNHIDDNLATRELLELKNLLIAKRIL